MSLNLPNNKLSDAHKFNLENNGNINLIKKNQIQIILKKLYFLINIIYVPFS